MENKKLVSLVYRIFNLLISDLKGESVNIGAEIEMKEMIDMVASISGESPTLKSVLKSRYTPSEYKEALSGIIEDLGGEITKDRIKSFFERDWQLSEDLLKDSDLDWIMGELKKEQKNTKKESVQQSTSLDNTREFMKKLIKFLRDIEIGNSVDFDSIFPEKFIKDVFKEVFNKDLTLFDVYSEKEIKEDLLWGFDPGERSLSEYLIEEMEVPEYLLNKEVLKKLEGLL
jgi:hypothetical protein